MASGKNTEADGSSSRVIEELRTTNRLLAILATRGMEQKEAIALLHGLGFPARTIAAALFITPNAVNIALHRLRKAEVSTEEAGKKTNKPSSETEEAEGNG